MYSLKCTYYDKEFTTIKELIEAIQHFERKAKDKRERDRTNDADTCERAAKRMKLMYNKEIANLKTF